MSMTWFFMFLCQYVYLCVMPTKSKEVKNRNFVEGIRLHPVEPILPGPIWLISYRAICDMFMARTENNLIPGWQKSTNNPRYCFCSVSSFKPLVSTASPALNSSKLFSDCGSRSCSFHTPILLRARAHNFPSEGRGIIKKPIYPHIRTQQQPKKKQWPG